MIRRVLLVNAPDANCAEPFCRAPRPHPPLVKGLPLGLCEIATHLQAAGHYVALVDAARPWAPRWTPERIAAYAKDINTEVVGVSCYTVNRLGAVEIAKAVRKAIPNVVLVAGGPHATSAPHALTAHFDWVVRGPGGRALSWIAEKGGRAHGEVRSGEPDPDVYAARHLLDASRYIAEGDILPRQIEVVTSRGCSHRCAFCANQTAWRPRPLERVMQELNVLRQRYGPRSFVFFDDNFTYDRERVLALCRALRGEGYTQRWTCLARLDQVDAELLREMRKAGCVKLQFGLESANKEVRARLHKGVTLARAERAIRETHEAGLTALVYCIVGSPGETEETVRETVGFVCSVPCVTCWSVMQVLPGTELAELQPADWTSYLYRPEVDRPSRFASACVPVFLPKGMDRERVKALHAWARRRCLLSGALRHPLYAVGRAVRTPAAVWNHLGAILR